MIVEFTKSTIIRGKRWPAKTKLRVTPQKGKELLSSGFAEEYKGVFPPKGKVKVDLKQLKA